jgi:hypothetical protein
LVSSLGLVAGVKQKRVTLGPPRVVVTNTPNGDTDAVLLGRAGLDDAGPVVGRRILNIDFSQSALWGGGAERGHGSRCVGSLAGGQMALRADAVDGDAGCDPGLDIADYALRLGVTGGVEAGDLSVY